MIRCITPLINAEFSPVNCLTDCVCIHGFTGATCEWGQCRCNNNSNLNGKLWSYLSAWRTDWFLLASIYKNYYHPDLTFRRRYCWTTQNAMWIDDSTRFTEKFHDSTLSRQNVWNVWRWLYMWPWCSEWWYMYKWRV